MSALLHRLGGLAVRRRWAFVAVWLVVLIGVGIAGTTLSKPTEDGFSVPGTESQRAIDLLSQKFPGTGGAAARVVVEAPPGHTLTEAPYAAKIRTALAEVAKAPQVIGVSSSADTTLSKDKTIGFADVHYAVTVDKVTDASKAALQKIAQPLRAAGMKVEYSGGVIATSGAAGHSSEVYGILIGFLVLMITFGSLVSAGMPLLMALVGVGLGLLGIQAATSVITLTSTAPTLALMLGLAVGIDYTLFIVSRHRAQRAAGMDNSESIAMATATAGGAVVFAGLTVVIALVALTVVGIPFLTAMGLAAAATVAVTVLVAITLVPAVLGLLGDRIDKGAIRFLSRRHPATDDVAQDSPAAVRTMGERWAHLVTAKPWLTVSSVVVVCAVVALPLLHMRLGLPDDGEKSTSTTERRAYDMLTEGFGPGFNGPLTLVIYTPQGTNALALAVKAKSALLTVGDVVAVGQPIPNQVGDVAILSVTPRSAPASTGTKNLVNQIRAAAAQVRAQSGVEAFVTGTTAVNIDVSTKLANALPVFLSVIVGLALLLLMLVFRSIWVPLKAVGGFLLSIGASLGLVVAVFQDGHLGSLFNVAATGPVLSFLPVLLIGILFGLAMDYEVFLVSRIHESYLDTRDPSRAITAGMHHSARVVTAAGIIMLAVFGSFILAPDPITKSIGLALAFGVLVDAFLVRMTLVPAVLQLLGHRAWWLPGWLEKRLPDLDIEGTKLEQTHAG